jgi:hypothetical protein
VNPRLLINISADYAIIGNHNGLDDVSPRAYFKILRIEGTFYNNKNKVGNTCPGQFIKWGISNF